MYLSGKDAHFLLFALDAYCEVDKEGKLTKAKGGSSLQDLQDLRDRLFAAHEHPNELVAILEYPKDWGSTGEDLFCCREDEY
jgi:hypothetical protein